MEKAVSLNPSLPLARTMLGQLLILDGRPLLGIDHLLEALRVKSNDPEVWGVHAALALGHYVAGNFAESLAWAVKCHVARPQFLLPWAIAAASAVGSGDAAEGKNYIRMMQEHNSRIDPFEILFTFLGASKKVRNRFINHVAQAGFELNGASVKFKRLMMKVLTGRLLKSADKLERRAALEVAGGNEGR
jgi:hypothetical protein